MNLKPLTATHDYIGINEHGECTAICVDEPEWKKETARTLAEWIREGLSVERHPHEEACRRFKAGYEARKQRKARVESPA